MADSEHTRIASAIPQDASSIKPSRRLFLAAGSASAVFGALSQAAAQEGADPIFAAIADSERATDKAEAAEAAANEAREAYDAACREIGLVSYSGEDVRSLRRLDFLATHAPPVSEFEIKVATDELFTLPRERSDYLQAQAALFERIEAFERAERDSRVRELDKVLLDAWSAESDAAFAVIEMEPTTRAGAMAQLRVLASRFLDDMIEDRIAEIAADTIDNALDLIEWGGRRDPRSNLPDRRSDRAQARHAGA